MRNSLALVGVIALASTSTAATTTPSSAFVVRRPTRRRPSSISMSIEEERRRRRAEFPAGSPRDGGDQSRHLDELSWRAEKVRLEEANTRSFLRRRPRKLRYEDARRWVQANLGPDTEEDFHDMVANGNLRTPYIPKRPEEYYTETGEWISWEHFLRGIFDTNRKEAPPSAIKPATGFFD